MSKEIYYSDKYEDDKYEYRHVMLPKVVFCLFPFLSKLFLNPDNHTVQALAKLVPKTHCMSEQEWRNLGVQQSLGWVVHTFPCCSPLSKFRKLALYAIKNCCSSLLKVCFQLIFWRWVHYMLHEPEPHILLFRCLQLLRKPWFHFIRPFSTGGPCPTSDLQWCLNGRKYMITRNFIGDAFERTYMQENRKYAIYFKNIIWKQIFFRKNISIMSIL